MQKGVNQAQRGTFAPGALRAINTAEIVNPGGQSSNDIQSKHAPTRNFVAPEPTPHIEYDDNSSNFDSYQQPAAAVSSTTQETYDESGYDQGYTEEGYAEEGYAEEGYDEGYYEEGAYEEGYAEEGYDEGYYEEGYEEGYDEGYYEEGYDEGYADEGYY